MPKLNLNPPFINGSGLLSYLDVFERLEKEGVMFGGWVTKSIGPQAKDGNYNPTIHIDGPIVMNSFALPTQSWRGWRNEFKVSRITKPIIGSCYGENPTDYHTVIVQFDTFVQGWELNLSCPNKVKGEKSLQEVVDNRWVKDVVEPLRSLTAKPIIAKLSPNYNYLGMTELVQEHVDYIGCGNTIGPGLAINIYVRKPILAGVYGGLSGEAIRPINMKMVNDVYNAVHGSELEIIAYGGISKWQDVIEYAIAGASVYGIGTALLNKNTQQIVKFTKDLCEGVDKFLKSEGLMLQELVGSLRK
ncbi:hypothetical protein KY330_00970 [Candidatus Woesearchaeota archaeon]|nr:hypothetical protein [Candidatus Woesearchaeota archaeon]